MIRYFLGKLCTVSRINRQTKRKLHDILICFMFQNSPASTCPVCKWTTATWCQRPCLFAGIWPANMVSAFKFYLIITLIFFRFQITISKSDETYFKDSYPIVYWLISPWKPTFLQLSIYLNNCRVYNWVYKQCWAGPCKYPLSL